MSTLHKIKCVWELSFLGDKIDISFHVGVDVSCLSVQVPRCMFVYVYVHILFMSISVCYSSKVFVCLCMCACARVCLPCLSML